MSSHKIKEEVKTIQSKIKKNVQGTNSDGKETRTYINGLDQKEKQTFNQNRMKKQELKKKKREGRRKGLGTSRTSLNVPTAKS